MDLNLSKACCKEKASMQGKISPFKRAIALEVTSELWPDGAMYMSGLAQCHSCSKSWAFCMKYEEYHLSELNGDIFNRLLDSYLQCKTVDGKQMKPKWPVWTPPSVYKLSIDDCKKITEIELSIPTNQWSIAILTKSIIGGRIHLARVL